MGGSDRFEVLLDAFIARSRLEGERTVSIARIVISALLVGRIVAVGPTLQGGTPRQALHVVMLLLAVVAALLIRRAAGRSDPGRRSSLVGASVILDSVTLATALLALVIWPSAGYAGLAQSGACGYVFLCIVFSALRFSMGLSLTAVIVNGLSLTGLLLLDHYYFGRPVLPEALLTIVSLYIATTAFCFVAMRRAYKLLYDGVQSFLGAERATSHLGAYVSPEVAERALSGDELALGGTRQQVVCLFSDLRGFTAYSESLPPEQLVGELNAYLEAMVAAATSDGGVIDKYIGDAIMVVFGTDTPSPVDAARAILTARAMQKAMARHNDERAERGLPPLAQGIGIHGGPAIVGNVGTKERMQHTVVGSVVNIASRLESATKDMDVPVLVSGEIVEAARRVGLDLPTLQELPAMRFRGVSAPLPVFTFASDGTHPSVPDLAHALT